ncbi:TraR/DksA family transcriptional regulator [Pedococcus sp. 5OH_020]|uniref:TraR/DksA family transcriptional regulator n=1 Tax=Pedococcus sp. 5OH_020 TaxID=2989814 RepID=UPI0022E99C19|nr:TraR/DksA C4-type zinc finger protein [Pedococcus sp. 5OH_020]
MVDKPKAVTKPAAASKAASRSSGPSAGKAPGPAQAPDAGQGQPAANGSATEKVAPVKKVVKAAAKVAKAATKQATRAATTKKAGVSTPAAKRATPTKRPGGTTAPARSLRVRDDESPWSAKELRELREEIETDVAHLRAEIQVAEADLVGLMRDAGDGAGDDQADAGAKTFEREQEISLANNARDMLDQNLHALERMDNGTYGICESCGNPIGKLRLQAAPRATLCVTCKTKQERR